MNRLAENARGAGPERSGGPAGWGGSHTPANRERRPPDAHTSKKSGVRPYSAHHAARSGNVISVHPVAAMWTRPPYQLLAAL